MDGVAEIRGKVGCNCTILARFEKIEGSQRQARYFQQSIIACDPERL